VNEAEWFQERGIAAFVLKYRLPVHGYRHPVPLLDAQRAMRLVRHRAEEWNLDASQIGLMGFSAGGHLASTLNTHFDDGNRVDTDPVERMSCRPDFTVLVYPVISMDDAITHHHSKANLLGPNPDPELVHSVSNEKHVNALTPPTLLVHAQDDGPVPIENSRLMLAALQEAGVLSLLHEYPTGGHGFGYHHNQENKVPGWLDRVHHWLQKHGFIA
jgi:acetyl esterase/lipase